MPPSSTLTAPVAPRPAREVVPPLEQGDRLTRAEFERRYHAMPHVKKAELIEGKVYMPSPVRLRSHARPHLELSGWLYNYKMATPGTEAADNATVRLDFENEPQPDVLLQILSGAGQASETDDDYLEGAPELTAEVASSSASYDVHEKKRAYRRNGVREYLVWLVDENRIEWWELKDGDYVSLPVENGIIKSRVFPGLWLDTKALVHRQSADVQRTLQQGLASEEHARFVARLQTARAKA